MRWRRSDSVRSRLLAFAVELIREALALSGDRPCLFPSHLTDRAIEPGAATVGIKRAKELLGLGDFRTHDLRRTAATPMAEMGINPHTISLILNHVSAGDHAGPAAAV
jgi:integrase